MGHDNLYTHNDVYDGYHCAISTSQSIAETTKPSGIGNANNVISFNHVYNLLQGIMNDGGSIRIDGGNSVFTAAGNKILNNKIHDVTDASIMDSNGYGGHGIYMDDNTGLVDVENNLVYRVSGSAVYTPHGPARPKEANTIKNNILAYARLAMVSVSGSLSERRAGGNPTGICRHQQSLLFRPDVEFQPAVPGAGRMPVRRRGSLRRSSSSSTATCTGAPTALSRATPKRSTCSRSPAPVRTRLVPTTRTTWTFYHILRMAAEVGRMRKASCRIPGSPTRPIRRTITPCPRDRRESDSSSSTRVRPAAPIR